MVKHLSVLFSHIIKLELVPREMTIGLMLTILKPNKKDKQNPDNYRGITLLPVIYKLFEKVTLRRMYHFLLKKGISFPHPSQCAYQKVLSSLNASFGLQETINYNINRGSKIFVCMMDNVKAFDVVWHSGLFLRLHELGIQNKLWRVTMNAYINMQYQGITSDLFPVQQ